MYPYYSFLHRSDLIRRIENIAQELQRLQIAQNTVKPNKNQNNKGGTVNTDSLIPHEKDSTGKERESNTNISTNKGYSSRNNNNTSNNNNNSVFSSTNNNNINSNNYTTDNSYKEQKLSKELSSLQKRLNDYNAISPLITINNKININFPTMSFDKMNATPTPNNNTILLISQKDEIVHPLAPDQIKLRISLGFAEV